MGVWEADDLNGRNDRIDMDCENQANFWSKNISVHRYGPNLRITIPADVAPNFYPV